MISRLSATTSREPASTSSTATSTKLPGPPAAPRGGCLRFMTSLWSIPVWLVLGPILLILLLAWVLVGIVLTTPVIWLCSWTIAVTWGMYLLAGRHYDGGLDGFFDAEVSDYGFDSSLFDVVVVASVTALLFPLVQWLSRHRRIARPLSLDDPLAVPVWSRLPAPGELFMAFAFTVLCVVKLSLYSPFPESNHPKPWSVAVIAALCLWSCALSAARFWRPTSKAQLCLAEADLLKRAKVPFATHTVAGIHTVCVQQNSASRPPFPFADSTHYHPSDPVVSEPGAHPSYGPSDSNADPGPNGVSASVDDEEPSLTHGSLPSGPAERPVLVLVHGFGAGAPMWVHTLPILRSEFSSIYCLDWLGVGRSDRPRDFPKNDAEAAETWFANALEEWRVQMGIDNFVLVGHSLGAVIVTAYNAKFPRHIRHLVLASPAHGPDFSRAPNFFFAIVRRGWNMNLTPQSLVRFVGPFGPGLVKFLVRRRYRVNGFPEDYLESLSAYVYHNFAGRGSGEYALNSVLMPGARARVPMEPRLTPSTLNGAPLTVIYGGVHRDWMDKSFGRRVVEAYGKEGGSADIHFIDDAGHQVFLDQPERFSRKLLEAFHSRQPGPATGGESETART